MRAAARARPTSAARAPARDTTPTIGGRPRRARSASPRPARRAGSSWCRRSGRAPRPGPRPARRRAPRPARRRRGGRRRAPTGGVLDRGVGVGDRRAVGLALDARSSARKRGMVIASAASARAQGEGKIVGSRLVRRQRAHGGDRATDADGLLWRREHGAAGRGRRGDRRIPVPCVEARGLRGATSSATVRPRSTARAAGRTCWCSTSACPGSTAWTCAGAARGRPGLPVLMLTARADEVDFVVGLDAGADDYVAKPFRLAELLARIRALLRRRAPEALEVNGVRLELAARQVTVDGVEVALANKEFELLRVLSARRPGRHPRGDPARGVERPGAADVEDPRHAHVVAASQARDEGGPGPAADRDRARRRVPLQHLRSTRVRRRILLHAPAPSPSRGGAGHPARRSPPAARRELHPRGPRRPVRQIAATLDDAGREPTAGGPQRGQLAVPPGGQLVVRTPRGSSTLASARARRRPGQREGADRSVRVGGALDRRRADAHHQPQVAAGRAGRWSLLSVGRGCGRRDADRPPAGRPAAAASRTARPGSARATSGLHRTATAWPSWTGSPRRWTRRPPRWPSSSSASASWSATSPTSCAAG